VDSRQLELRVAKALDAERKLSKNEFESLERESKDLQRLLGEYKREAEWAKGEMVGVRDELRQAKAQVERLSQEKVQMMEEHQGVLDQVRAD
jgi:chromosome segregation ATPase